MISDNIEDYTAYSTTGDNTWSSSVTINPHCFGRINGNLNLPEGCGLYFNKGCLEVRKDCKIASLTLQNEEDYLLVNGDFEVYDGIYHYFSDAEDLSAGTLELKGNFTQSRYAGNYCYAYCEKNTHKTIFSGNETQTVFFGNSTYLNKFEKNSNR